jgi:dTMP kinase
VVLEGLDGSGTTTQMKLLDERLASEHVPHAVTCEPTDGPIGVLIRRVLSLDSHALPRTIALLFAADRNEHVHSPDGMIARTQRGELVISDRYMFSSLAYQSIQCGFEYVHSLNSAFPLPRLVFFIDTPVDVCQRRLSRRGKPELFDGLDFQARVRQAYLDTFARFEDSGITVAIVDGDRPMSIINDELWKVLSGLPIH